MVARLLRPALVAAAAAACTPATGSPGEGDRGEGRAGAAADGLVPVELATVGLDASRQMPVVLLRDTDSGKIMPIWVGMTEAQAILRALLGLETPRPMTHDLLADVLRELGATVQEVQVHDLRETTFIGRIRLRVQGESGLRDVDSRPSDALALAVRTGALIRVAEALLEDPPEFDFLAPEAADQVVRILGTTVVMVTPALRQQYGLPDRSGVLVLGVYGEAAEKGLRRGDLVLEVNGETPRQPMDFLEAVLAARDVVRIVVWRDGAQHEVELSPAAARPPGPAPGRRAERIQT